MDIRESAVGDDSSLGSSSHVWEDGNRVLSLAIYAGQMDLNLPVPRLGLGDQSTVGGPEPGGWSPVSLNESAILCHGGVLSGVRPLFAHVLYKHWRGGQEVGGNNPNYISTKA